jgi:hypothetical protein
MALKTGIGIGIRPRAPLEDVEAGAVLVPDPITVPGPVLVVVDVDMGVEEESGDGGRERVGCADEEEGDVKFFIFVRDGHDEGVEDVVDGRFEDMVGTRVDKVPTVMVERMSFGLPPDDPR